MMKRDVTRSRARSSGGGGRDEGAQSWAKRLTFDATTLVADATLSPDSSGAIEASGEKQAGRLLVRGVEGEGDRREGEGGDGRSMRVGDAGREDVAGGEPTRQNTDEGRARKMESGSRSGRLVPAPDLDVPLLRTTLVLVSVPALGRREPLCLGSGADRGKVNVSGLDRLVVRAGNAVGRGDFELEEGGLKDGREELEGGGVRGGKDDGRGRGVIDHGGRAGRDGD